MQYCQSICSGLAGVKNPACIRIMPQKFMRLTKIAAYAFVLRGVNMNFKITKRPNPRAKGSYIFHASPFYSDELTILDLAKDISDGCTLNVTDVEAVLSSLVRKLPLFLKKGFIIQLGSFGRIRLSFSAKGKEKASDVEAADISCKRIVLVPCSEIRKEIESTTFSKVNVVTEGSSESSSEENEVSA